MKSGVMVQSIERAISIINCFSKDRPQLRLRDIADELQLNKSTVHGILNTLKHYGYLDQDEETQKYRLGLKLVEIGNQVLNSLELRSVATPIIKGVSGKTGETVHMVILDGWDVVYIDKAESSQSMRITTDIGSRYSAHCTGVGKALLAYKSREELMKILPDKLERLTEQTITDKEELIAHLQEVYQRGYAIDDEENAEGLRCVAAPIFDHRGKAVAAISVAGPSVRITKERIGGFVAIIREAAVQISVRLGYHP
ncbi:MAG: IclR family transcriptional regulator [Desulfitobacterium hafniense]|nr:IclR family transcriptional regulator [Desulfitobacterium hafniense]